MLFRLFITFLFSLILASCGTAPLSKNDITSIKSGEKAIIKTFNQPLMAGMVFGSEPVTQILSIDGKKVDSKILKLDEQVAVNVGTHEVEFACVNRAGQDDRDFRETMRLDLKPHHEYLVRCSFDSHFGPNGTYRGAFSVKEKRIKK